MEMITIYFNRKSIRLKNYDYSQNGIYFITICTHNREEILSKIALCEMCRGGVPSPPSKKYILTSENNIPPSKNNHKIQIIHTNTSIGKIVEHEIYHINKTNIKIFPYVIMPDHIHFIVHIFEGEDGTPPLHSIIGRFKSYTTKKYNEFNKETKQYKKLWQRNYYEHVIRNEKEYFQICEYIYNNPIRYVQKYYNK